MDIGGSSSRDLVTWLEAQSAAEQILAASQIFGELISGHGQPRITPNKARIKLCGFVELCARSESKPLRGWAYSEEQGQKLLDLYFDGNGVDSGRSLRLILDLIVELILRNPNKVVADAIKTSVVVTLLRIVAGRSTKPLAKSAIRVLDRFVSKSVVSLEEVGIEYGAVKGLHLPITDLLLWKTFLGELFSWMKLHFICPVAGKLVATVLSQLRQASSDGFLKESAGPLTLELWHEWLLSMLKQEPGLLDGLKSYVFMTWFKSDRDDALRFLQMMNSLGDGITSPKLELGVKATLQLAALEVGKRVGLVEEPVYANSGQGRDECGIVVLHEGLLSHVLVHPSAEIRAHALSLIVSSSSTTRPYSDTALRLLKRHLSSYFADPDAKFRNDILGKMRDMYKRIRGGIAVIKRSITRAKSKVGGDGSGPKTPAMRHTTIIYHSEDDLACALENQVSFLRWYIDFLRSELAPTASYQRHVTSLKAVLRIVQLEGDPGKTWETKDDSALFFGLFGQTWSRVLLDLLMDPFDDVREAASAVLKLLFADKRYEMLPRKELSPCTALSNFLSLADCLASLTGRAYHADGVARAFDLLHHFSDSEAAQHAVVSDLISNLEGKISSAEQDLAAAVLEAPTHGLFAALSYIVQSVNENRQVPDTTFANTRRLYTCCRRMWEVVQHVLCDDSPEGYLPDDLDDTEGLDTKTLLSYSFRGVDESSKLMRAMILEMKKRDGVIPGTLKDVLADIGRLAFIQLSRLRHRGALTTVSQTFLTCCQFSPRLENNSGGDSLLKTWYQGGISCILTQASTTRRSAGIPSIITAILSANTQDISIEIIMNELMRIARIPAGVHETDGSRLPQVHASNCLTVIFKTGSLSHLEKKLGTYLPLCLQLAADNLRSETWAIRNSGLLLLRGLMDSLFGTNESKTLMEAGWDGKANRIHYGRYSTLPPVLLGLLQSGRRMILDMTAGATAEAVFPALDIIRRAGPPPALRDELQQHIVEYLGSPVWHVREMAARTLCSCLLHDQWLESLTDILKYGEGPGRKNYVHGALLTARFLVERLGDVMKPQLTRDFDKLATTLQSLGENGRWAYVFSDCPDLCAAYLEVINLAVDFGLRMHRAGDSQTKESVHGLLLERHQVNAIASAGSYGALLRKQLAIHRAYCLMDPQNTQWVIDDTQFAIHHRQWDGIAAALEALSKIWGPPYLSEPLASQLVQLYTDVCLGVSSNETKALAMQNLTEILASTVGKDLYNTFQEKLKQVWSSLHLGSLNPHLSNEIIRASGVFLTYLDTPNTTQLDNYAYLIASASQDSQPFDARIAAAESLHLALTRTTTNLLQPTDALHPIFQSLYTTLNSDDEEVRLTAASVFSDTPGPAVPTEAAIRFLRTLAGASGERISAAAACRLIGHIFAVDDPVGELDGWVPAQRQLEEAMRVDDSLFVVEEQNLFVDEVREAKRWSAVLASQREVAGPAAAALRTWTDGGLRALLKVAAERDDGPLGWTSSPGVFAICTRIMLAAVVLVKTGLAPEFDAMLDELRDVGRKGKISGLLMEMLDWELSLDAE